MESVRSIEDLSKRGFDIDAGIAMCAGDEEVYVEVLDAAREEGKEKIPLIRELYENKDFERYCVEVHGLKNAIIGFVLIFILLVGLKIGLPAMQQWATSSTSTTSSTSR